MPAVRLLPPQHFFDRAEWAAVTRASAWRGLWLVAHAWIVSIAAVGLAAWSGHPAAWLLAVIVVGGRQLGLAILMHDAAHGALHPNRKVNNFLGQWLAGAAVGSDLIAYRTYHLQHHKYTQQPEDPDLSLSKPFPTTRASLGRKIVRDLTGQTFSNSGSRSSPMRSPASQPCCAAKSRRKPPPERRRERRSTSNPTTA
jgi:fatty acid desaturase